MKCPFFGKSFFSIIWNLKIRGKSINLDELGVKTSTERLTHFYIKQIIRVVGALQLCCGKKLSNEECLSFTNTVQVNGVGNDNYDICYRSPKCQQIISWYNIKNNQMCRKCQKDISYEKQKTVKSSGRIPLATYMYVQNTCIMNTDNLENEIKDNSTDSTDENNNLINKFFTTT
jgi:hypothetical protein